MVEQYKGGSSFENIGDDGGSNRERGVISRKNLIGAIRTIIPKRFKSSEEHFNNKWDAIYKPLSNGEKPNSFQVGARLIRRNVRADINGIKKLASTVAEGASKIADAVPKTTASLSGQDSSSPRTLVDAQERVGLLSSEDGETHSADNAKRRIPRQLDPRSRSTVR